MKILVAAMAAGLLGIAANAAAGALDECQTAGDHAAVSRCLLESDRDAQASLRNAEAAAGTRARELDAATGRPIANAALAKSLRAFAEYRTLQCDFIRAMSASGNDLTRRRVREL